MKRPRKIRLELEYENLLQLQSRTAFDKKDRPLIEIEPKDQAEGFPPERYFITYRCKSIIGIKENGAPIYAYQHQIELFFGTDFMLSGPSISASTAIWHPNIDHKYPYHIDAPINFRRPFNSICDLVITIGEMIQYKKYHAQWTAPYPMDVAAADWVIKYAEPNGILGKDKPVDDTDLLRRPVNIYPRRSDMKDREEEEDRKNIRNAER